VPATRTITPADATLVVNPIGGALSANLTFRVAPDTSLQRTKFSKDAVLVGTRPEINFIPGSNVTLAVTDMGATLNRIDVTISAAGGGSMVDPTQNPGDLIVRGSSTTTNLPVGTPGQVLTVDAASGLKMKWAAQAVGVPTSRAVNTTGPTLMGGGPLSGDLTLYVVADTIVQQTRVSIDGVLRGTRRETNFVTGSNITLTVTDDTPNNRVNVQIDSTASGGGPQTPWATDIDAAGKTLFSAGKIGIGIALPQAPLHIVSSAVTNALIESTGATGAYAVLNLKTVNSQWQIAVGAWPSTSESWYVYSQTAAATRLLINASGYVGIGTGTTDPKSLLQVGQGSPLSAGIADFYGPNRTLAAGTSIVNVFTTDAVVADKGGTLGLGGVGGAANPFAFAILAGRSDGGLGYAGYLQVATMNSAGNPAEWMRVTSTGRVGIGTSSPLRTLHVNGALHVSGSALVAVTAPNSVTIDNVNGASRLISFGPDSATHGTFQFISVFADNSNVIIPLAIDTVGNVGVNTTAPAATLHITRAGDSTILVESTGASSSYDQSIQFKDATTQWYVGQKWNVTDAFGIGQTPAKSAFVMTATGYAGFGLDNPVAKCQVEHPAGTIGFWASNSVATWGTVANFNAHRFFKTYSAATDGTFKEVHIGPGGIAIGFANTPPYGSSDGLRVNGNIGVRTESVYGNLHVNGPDGIVLSTSASTDHWKMFPSTGQDQFFLGYFSIGAGGWYNGNIPMITIGFPNDRMGIRKTSPAYCLDVGGDCNVSGAFRMNGVATAGMFNSANQTPNRVLNGTYQNPYGRPMFISVYAIVGQNGYIRLLTDSGNRPLQSPHGLTRPQRISLAAEVSPGG
jgi:hypothetical protein